jgi:aryl-alcohol dehydrogenase-like predicted oxidoreductase
LLNFNLMPVPLFILSLSGRSASRLFVIRCERSGYSLLVVSACNRGLQKAVFLGSQAMERKVARASDERSDSEKRELTRKIKELQAELDQKNNEHTMLHAQVSLGFRSGGRERCLARRGSPQNNKCQALVEAL